MCDDNQILEIGTDDRNGIEVSYQNYSTSYMNTQDFVKAVQSTVECEQERTSIMLKGTPVGNSTVMRKREIRAPFPVP